VTFAKVRWVLFSSALVIAACGRSPGVAPEAPVDGAAAAPEPEATPAAWVYPNARRSDHVDVYHGVDVPDPYRWLEKNDSDGTKAWIAAQNALTFDVLDDIEARKAIRTRLTSLWDYERWGVPRRHGEVYVVDRNDGLQNQSVMYTLTSLDGTPEVLIDPNTLSSDGTVALAGSVFSHDGKRVAYGVSEAGSDWEVWKVRDVTTGEDLEDELRWIKFNKPTWSRDGKGFYYSRYEPPEKGKALADVNEKQRLHYHRLGQPQSDDEVVYARPDRPKWGFSGKVTDDGRYLVITVKVGTEPKTSIFFQDLRASKPKTVELLPDFTARWRFLDNVGTKFWFFTDEDAPRGKIVEIDVRRPTQRSVLVPESEDTLRGVSVVGNRFIAEYLHDAASRVRVFRLDGKHERDVELPGLGTVSGWGGKRQDKETFYAYNSFATPATVYRYDVVKGTSEVFREPSVGFDPADYETEQVFYRSADGTQVPMFISYRKGLERDGNNPTYLYGYGGFNIPVTPSFSVANLVWMEMGGIYAVANLRGGGEFGERWHTAGTRLVKQNVFDDFIAAAEYLIAQKWTSTPKLSIGGRSNGGLLVGAAITQRPDLFGAALPGVGVLDMLRFNKFTIGWAWESDYGSPQNADEFAALHAYSPYHNVREGTEYPATLIYTADHDDRVVPAHSYKFAAALQHAQTGNKPVLIRIDTRSGHGAGKPTSKRIEEWVDLWGFLVDTLDMNVDERWAVAASGEQ
jgi:prolyl oligopeptidase